MKCRTLGHRILSVLRENGSYGPSLASARLADLQWPNFSENSAAVKEFYDESGSRLGWSRGGKPTAHPVEMIGILSAADQKGLDSRDHDGAKWQQRLKALQSPGEATESALVTFDVALTVSAIRYGTDLHLGKVDPKILHKDFDPLTRLTRQEIEAARDCFPSEGIQRLSGNEQP